MTGAGAAVPGRDVLDRRVLQARALEVAPALLGAVVEADSPEGLVAVRLTEVEAYEGRDDPGSHAYRGRTPRTAVMFGPAGHLYVYFSYGMHWCANVVCGPDGTASAVLLRAGEVVAGHELARSRRPAARTDRDLARGPARLAQALGLGREHDGTDACGGGPVRLVKSAAVPPSAVRSGPRVGVNGPGGDAGAHPWRFWLDGEPTVSAYRPGTARRRARRPG
ncbi:DNA-3-methyladenine glycosylase [Thalassiella azotivora]